jgi:hypothetical protein
MAEPINPIFTVDDYAVVTELVLIDAIIKIIIQISNN